MSKVVVGVIAIAVAHFHDEALELRYRDLESLYQAEGIKHLLEQREQILLLELPLVELPGLEAGDAVLVNELRERGHGRIAFRIGRGELGEQVAADDLRARESARASHE